ncbi:MAG TPA: hypothetical protein VGP93_07160 [Polyangiaceae bacterium]|nr:hypothetical protein [Polyangiaceae bacterium]
MIGRAWRDIDYRGEGLSWEKQQSVYAPNGVVDFKTAEHLALFFRIESKAAYFQKLYRPRGAPP